MSKQIAQNKEKHEEAIKLKVTETLKFKCDQCSYTFYKYIT